MESVFFQQICGERIMMEQGRRCFSKSSECFMTSTCVNSQVSVRDQPEPSIAGLERCSATTADLNLSVAESHDSCHARRMLLLATRYHVGCGDNQIPSNDLVWVLKKNDVDELSASEEVMPKANMEAFTWPLVLNASCL